VISGERSSTAPFGPERSPSGPERTAGPLLAISASDLARRASGRLWNANGDRRGCCKTFAARAFRDAARAIPAGAIRARVGGRGREL